MSMISLHLVGAVPGGLFPVASLARGAAPVARVPSHARTLGLTRAPATRVLNESSKVFPISEQL